MFKHHTFTFGIHYCYFEINCKRDKIHGHLLVFMMSVKVLSYP